MIAWSTPGAAVLAPRRRAAAFDMAEAVGAFIVFAPLMTLAGATGWFERVMDRIPMPLANALLAGVLARFGLRRVHGRADRRSPLVLLMLAAYLRPRAAGRATRCRACSRSASRSRRHGHPHGRQAVWRSPLPVFTVPEFSWQAAVSLALPLFVVTMASQNLPGVAAIRAAGYGCRSRSSSTMTGVSTLLLAPFGAFALNLAAITAAICMGREAHADPARRYIAAAVVRARSTASSACSARPSPACSTAFPRELVAAVAGLALLGTIGGGLVAAVRDDTHREAALITFLVTLSGRRRWPASARRSGVSSPARWRLLCNSGGPAPHAAPTPDRSRHETALRRRSARGLQDLQGHDLRDDARGAAARPRDRTPASRSDLRLAIAAAGRGARARRSRSTGDDARLVPCETAAAATIALARLRRGHRCARTRRSTPNTSTRRTCSSRPSAKARACSTSPRRCATTRRSSRSWSSRSSSRRRWSRATTARCSASTPSTGDIILKPLDGMGGMGIFRVGPDGLNLGSIIETLNDNGATHGHGAALHARDRAGRQARAGDRRQAGAAFASRAFRKAARCAATSPPAARASRSRSRRATGRSPRRSARCWRRAACCWSASTSSATASPRSTSPARPASRRSRSRPASTSPAMFIDALEAAMR